MTSLWSCDGKGSAEYAPCPHVHTQLLYGAQAAFHISSDISVGLSLTSSVPYLPLGSRYYVPRAESTNFACDLAPTFRVHSRGPR
eukprot:838642-Heterocapsa_arctica.AAC.1